MNKSLPNKDKVISSSFDGFPRKTEDEEMISLNINSLFSQPTGKAVLQYLRSITIEAVHGSAVSNEVLRHVEGSRFIVGVIERRMRHGQKVTKEDNWNE